MIGLAGIAATVITALGVPFLAAQRAEKEWLRQQRVNLYQEAMLHAHLLSVGAARATDDTVGWHRYERGGSAKLTPSDELTARMDLLAHQEVADAWHALTEAQESLEWHVIEEIGDPTTDLPDTTPQVIEVRRAVTALRTACREAIGAGA